MSTLFLSLQSILAISVTFLILIQLRGSGISGGKTSASFTRRGLDKLVFRLNFFASGLFLVVSILSIVA